MTDQEQIVYTPTTEYVRDFYAKFQANLELHCGYLDEQYDQAEAEFDRWLDRVKREAAAQALEDAAEAIESLTTCPTDVLTLRARAAAIRDEAAQ